jgi:hypothetical protein
VTELHGLIEKRIADEDRRRDESEKDDHRQERGREALPTSEPGAQFSIRRKEHEREQRGPEAGREEGLEDADQEIAEDDGRREAEDTRVEPVL